MKKVLLLAAVGAAVAAAECQTQVDTTCQSCVTALTSNVDISVLPSVCTAMGLDEKTCNVIAEQRNIVIDASKFSENTPAHICSSIKLCTPVFEDSCKLTSSITPSPTPVTPSETTEIIPEPETTEIIPEPETPVEEADEDEIEEDTHHHHRKHRRGCGKGKRHGRRHHGRHGRKHHSGHRFGRRFGRPHHKHWHHKDENGEVDVEVFSLNTPIEKIDLNLPLEDFTPFFRLPEIPSLIKTLFGFDEEEVQPDAPPAFDAEGNIIAEAAPGPFHHPELKQEPSLLDMFNTHINRIFHGTGPELDIEVIQLPPLHRLPALPPFPPHPTEETPQIAIEPVFTATEGDGKVVAHDEPIVVPVETSESTPLTTPTVETVETVPRVKDIFDQIRQTQAELKREEQPKAEKSFTQRMIASVHNTLRKLWK